MARDARTDGGWTDDELCGSFAIALNLNNPSRLVELLEKYQERLSKLIGENVATAIRISALARSGDVVASKGLLDKSSALFSDYQKDRLEIEIVRASGQNPIANLIDLCNKHSEPMGCGHSLLN